MNFEEMQKAWQSQNAGAKVAINPDLLLNEVRRNNQQFASTILRRDVLEVSACVLMTAGFSAWGWWWHWWSLYFLAICCFVVGASFVVDRGRQSRKQPVKNDTLFGCIENSLFQVQHQIWLLKNILWWYLLPVILGVAAVTGQTVWTFRKDTFAATLVGIVFNLTYTFAYGFVYWVNQRTVEQQFEPRRKELETLLAELK
jgi:magnesium-transporting ATPase (P-type)